MIYTRNHDKQVWKIRDVEAGKEGMEEYDGDKKEQSFVEDRQ